MKIIVGMSGGVDSSVAAAILVRRGHKVVGAFMKNWTDTKDVSGVCDWKNDLRDARRVAAHLRIPLVVMDFQKEYRERVVDYLFTQYAAGRTPNPDVVCNSAVKFGPFLREAARLGADKIATGHYARVAVRGGTERATYHLLEARDKNKDQTYFLHQLTQTQLAYAYFPIGAYTKPRVRAMARHLGLPTAERKESMGLCFIGDVNMRDFLKQKITPLPGRVVTRAGRAVGEHEGLAFYTIGQRHGFGTAGSAAPLFVVAKNTATNELVVGEEDDAALLSNTILVSDMHWIAGEPPLPFRCLARFRHRQPLAVCSVNWVVDRYVVRTQDPVRAVAPGQFAVVYKDGVCLGGGTVA